MQGKLRWLTTAVAVLGGGAACSSVVTERSGGEPELSCEAGPGRVTLHRLNRTEYDNTVRDLLGVDLRPARDFPQDDLAHGFDNMADVLTVAPLLVEKYGQAAEDLAEAALADADARARLVPCDPARDGEEACLREVVARFLPRAFRRPVGEEEREEFVRLGQAAIADGEGFDGGVRVVVEAALLSPRFIFRVEEEPEPGRVRALDGFEVASRLSYFLWSTMPDDRLFEAAASGQLDGAEGIAAEVERMLASPKARAVVDNFGGQWLATRALSRAQPDATLFPEWNDALRDAMAEETRRVFAEIVSEGRPMTELLDADFTWVNERLARHYGIEGVRGDDFQRVPAPPERGGILGHGSFLTITSNPTRTSPVKRGVWVLSQLLCDDPPPPPPGVEGLPETGTPTGTLREQMEAHRSDPICASCHETMDSIGFGLENFGPTGRYREKDEAGFPIDASGELPGDRIFAGAVELAQHLKADPKLPACMAEQAMTYALGRALTRKDSCALEAVTRDFEAGGFTFEALARAIATSEPFRLRAAEDATGDAGGDAEEVEK